MATVKEIVDDAKAARKNLGELLEELQGEIDEIRLRAFFDGKRKLTAQEVEIRNARRAQKAEAQEAHIASTFLTLQALNNSEEVKKLSQRINDINAGLKDDLESLKDIVRYAETAAKVADDLAKVAEKLAALAA